MKKIIFFLMLSFAVGVRAQSFNEDKTAFTNFIKRMFSSTPFEGVKIIDDYSHQYLVSVISLDKAKYTSESVMHRVAQVKAQSQANTFINGASIDMNMVIKTTETKDASNNTNTIVETVEQIKQNSMGFTQGLELLTNFDHSDNKRMVFVFAREMVK
jgi:hypothetical protein